MSNFDRKDRARLIQTRRLARCDSTGREFSIGPVEVVARYSDCSVFVCPECKGQHDDRPSWGGPSERRMGYTLVTVRVHDGPRWVTP